MEGLTRNLPQDQEYLKETPTETSQGKTWHIEEQRGTCLGLAWSKPKKGENSLELLYTKTSPLSLKIWG